MITIPGRIPIRIFPFFWILILIIGWLNTETIVGTATWAVIIFISVLVHEYGHALTARVFGQEAEIDLVGLGGLTRREGAPIKLWQDFFVVLNGPVAGFLLFIIVYMSKPLFMLSHSPYMQEAFEAAIWVNLVWNILNLLPILPLDGGHLLRIIFEGSFGITGVKVALWISIVLSVLLSFYFFIIQAVIGGALFLIFAFESYRGLSDMKTMTSKDTDVDLKNLLAEAEADMKRGQRDEALSKLYALREMAEKGVLFVTATQYVARLLAEKGELKQAFQYLVPIQSQISPDYMYFFQQLAFRVHEWELAVKVGSKAYHNEPKADIALMNALSCAAMGQLTPALGWMRSAIQMGIGNPAAILLRKEFDPIRRSPEFEALKNSL